MEHDQTVGGDVQMGVIPSRGEAEWMLKPVQQPRILLGGAELIIGGNKSSLHGDIDRHEHFELAQSFDILKTLCRHEIGDFTISLDDGHFFGCTFERCTFVFKGTRTRLSKVIWLMTAIWKFTIPALRTCRVL